MYKKHDIFLSKLEFEDINLLCELKRESWSTTHRVTISNLEDQKRWFNSLSENVHAPENLILMASLEGVKFGIFKIFNVDYINRNADVGWDVFQESRGNGYGKDLVLTGTDFCFEILNLRRLTAEILSINEASRKCAENAGYVHEGTKRGAVKRDGIYLNSEIWGKI